VTNANARQGGPARPGGHRPGRATEARPRRRSVTVAPPAARAGRDRALACHCHSGHGRTVTVAGAASLSDSLGEPSHRA
jgi:hypothetical protein